MKADWKPFETEEEYEIGLERTIKLFHAEPGTPESDELEILLELVLAYEDVNFYIPEPDPNHPDSKPQ